MSNGSGLELITFTNIDTNEYFFSTDHCQQWRCQELYDHKSVIADNDNWVPCTSRIPLWVVPRSELPNGWITNLEDYVNIFHNDGKIIRNPDKEFQEAKIFTESMIEFQSKK